VCLADVASGGGEVRGKIFSDGSDSDSPSTYASTSESEDEDSSTAFRHSASHYADNMPCADKNGGALGMNLETFPRDCPSGSCLALSLTLMCFPDRRFVVIPLHTRMSGS